MMYPITTPPLLNKHLEVPKWALVREPKTIDLPAKADFSASFASRSHHAKCKNFESRPYLPISCDNKICTVRGDAMAADTSDKALREHLLYLLKGGGAHANFDAAIKALPVALRGERPAGADHSLWELLEHIRLAQWDILEFSRNPKHVSPKWPEGYWPETPAPPTAAAWSKSVKGYHADLDAMCQLVARKSTNLYAPIPRGDGQTILREALLIADHTAYHLGQIVLVRRLLGAWK